MKVWGADGMYIIDVYMTLVWIEKALFWIVDLQKQRSVGF